MPRRLLVPTLAAFVAFLGGCGETRSTPVTPETPAKQMATTPAPRSGTIATVASGPDGRTLVEFTLTGSTEAGTPYRVITADGSRIKGMIQVTDLPGAKRAIARVIALTDPADPPAPGDQVHELATLADAGTTPAAAAADPAEDARFTTLRTQYQRLIAEAVARHDADVAAIRTASDARIAEAEASLRKDLAERDRAHAADLAGAKAAGGETALAAVASERETATTRARTAVDERDRLRVEVDRLTTVQEELKRKIERTTAGQTENERTAKAQLTAEREAREQIAGRLAELEKREGGRATATAALLSREPGRDEGVLERLDRLSAETTVARDRAVRSEAAAAEAQEALLACRRSLAETEAARDAALGKVGAAADVDAKLATAQDTLAATRNDLAAARERHAAAELARLEAERALYDLSARVLRLPRAGAELAALQERLRATLGPMTPQVDATAPERRP